MPKVNVDENLCLGCGLCVNTAPQSFRLNPETHKSSPVNPPGDPIEKLKEAQESCPAGAIQVE